jgi:hypothetical protein
MSDEVLTIENKVANSGLLTLNLEELYDKAERVVLDIEPWLFRSLSSRIGQYIKIR